jgi:hypothetical protein
VIPFALPVAPYGRLTRLIMHRRRETSASSRTATTESYTTSPGITDDNGSFEPNSETDLTEPKCLPSSSQKAKRGKYGGPASRQPGTDFGEFRASETENLTDVSAMELVRRGRYEDPADDTDEDLSVLEIMAGRIIPGN